MLECGPKLVADDPEHLELLQQGVDVWNAWRQKKPSTFRPDLFGASLSAAHLSFANLSGADLSAAHLSFAKLSGADLSGADLSGANLFGADLIWADLSGANLSRASLSGAVLSGANLSGANLSGANLSGANLSEAQLVETNLVDATLTDCRIYGISAWNVKLNERTKQQGLIITPSEEPEVTVDDLEVAQFVYLLLSNENIRDVIDTVGRRGVLLLGRFTEGRIVVLERLRDELRKRGYLPIVFNFDKPETKDFTETVRLLAGLSKFVIADITNQSPRRYTNSRATIPEIMVPFQPIITAGREALCHAARLVDQAPGLGLRTDRIFVGRQADRDDGRGNHRARRDAVQRTRDAESRDIEGQARLTNPSGLAACRRASGCAPRPGGGSCPQSISSSSFDAFRQALRVGDFLKLLLSGADAQAKFAKPTSRSMSCSAASAQTSRFRSTISPQPARRSWR